MKKITTILLSTIVFGFVGCTTSDSPTNQELPNDNDYISSVIPEQSSGFGLEYDITGYFFPSSVLNERGVAYKNYVITTKNSDGYFNNQQRVIEHYIENNKNAYNEDIITFFQNDKLVKRSNIKKDTIVDITYDITNGSETTREPYSRLLQVGDDLIRNENGACIVKDRLTGFYTSDVIPLQADPNDNSPHYNSVLHFYCGTSKGTKIDRYYADGWGEIISIYTYNDNSVEYAVFDRNSYKNR